MRHPAHAAETGRVPWKPAILVAVVTAVTFSPALRNDFVNWDDVDNFLNNAHYRGLGWDNICWMFTTAHLGHYIPVTWLSLGLDYVLWRMNPWGYHLTSILLHATNALLFYLLAYRVLALGFTHSFHDLPPPRQRSSEDRRARQDRSAHQKLVLGAVVAALLFSVHPLRVESVAWITERRDLLAGLFSILMLLAYLKAFRNGAMGELRAGWYWSSVGLFALALLSKSIVVGLPLVLLALDLYPLRRKHMPGLLAEKAPYLLASTVVCVMMLMIGTRDRLMADLAVLDGLDRLAVFAYSLFFYLLKTVLPWSLSPLYDLHYPVRPLTATYLLPGIAVASISAAMIGLRRRWPAGLTAWAAYIALLLPVSGILQNGHQIAADRYTYLACLGWALMAGAVVTWCWGAREAGILTPRLARLGIALSAAVILALAALSTLQIRVWRDSETLWRHAIAADPGSPFAHFHLGGAFSILGKHEQARAEYAKAIALVSDVVDAKGTFYAALGRELHTGGDQQGAERNYIAALRYSPDDETALNNLGVIYARRGDDKAALDMFLRLLRATPGNDAACRNVRVISARLGVTPSELKECPRRDSSSSHGCSPASTASHRRDTIGAQG
jgi:tetratricopeptide (TPR) repeat protein